MKNYICINDQRIELSDEQVAQLKGSFNLPGVRLADVPVGDTCKIGAHEFVVLEHSGDTTAVILKNLLPDQEFGENNNYDGSCADSKCNQFAREMEMAVGSENLCLHTVDLTSDDGLKDYGSIKRKASLLTCEKYRRFVYILDKHKPDGWWWLATAWSTPAHDNYRTVKCVAPSGGILSGGCINDCLGVRPFCIFKSHIFVSK